MRIRNILCIILPVIILSTVILSFIHSNNQVSAAGSAVANVNAPTQALSPGQQFTVNIIVQPNNSIAGAQINLSFNPNLVTVNSVTEGNLFNQSGSNTYFMPGKINNTSGNITDVAGATIGSGHTVSSAGIFAVITMTVRTTAGTCSLNLANVIIADVNGQSVPVNTANNQVVIVAATTTTSTTTTAPTTTPPPPTEGGGGGGGGGPIAPASAAGVINLASAVDTKGIFNQDVLAFSDDNNFLLRITTGTTSLTSSGATLSQISMLHMAAAPAFSANAGIVGLAYDFTPSGTAFSPSATVRFGYDPALIPPGIAENKLQISYYDVAAKVWVALPSTVDISAHVVYAQIAHFTPYAVTYGVTNPIPALTTSTAPVVTSSTVTTQTTTTASSTTKPHTTTPTTSSTTTMATSESQTPTNAAAGLLNSDETPTTDVSTQQDGVKVVKLNILAISIGVDAILIILVVVVILLIRRNMLKNRQAK